MISIYSPFHKLLPHLCCTEYFYLCNFYFLCTMTASNTFPYLKKRILVVQEEQYELTPVEVLIFLDLPHVCWSKPVHNRQKNASGLCFYLFGRYRCYVWLNPSFFSFFFFIFMAGHRPRPSPHPGLLELNDSAVISVLRWTSIEVGKTLWKKKKQNDFILERWEFILSLLFDTSSGRFRRDAK